MPSASEWKVPASVQPKPEDYGYALLRGVTAYVFVIAYYLMLPLTLAQGVRKRAVASSGGSLARSAATCAGRVTLTHRLRRIADR